MAKTPTATAILPMFTAPVGRALDSLLVLRLVLLDHIVELDLVYSPGTNRGVKAKVGVLIVALEPVPMPLVGMTPGTVLDVPVAKPVLLLPIMTAVGPIIAIDIALEIGNERIGNIEE
jgi:hypothetical protein